MPRKKRYNRAKRFSIKKSAPKIKGIFTGIVLIAILAISFVYGASCLNGFLKESNLFTLSKIELAMNPFLKEALSLDFYGIPRRVNIFQIDIDAIGLNTQKKHPEFKSVIISRKLPNVISVRIEYKTPVAFLKMGSVAVPFSSDGVVLPQEAGSSGRALPFISGVNLKSSDVKVGNICADKKFALGIKFIMLAYSCWDIKGHRIALVDLKDTKDIYMFLENGIQVKMGDANSIKAKMALLKKIMDEPTLDFSKIKYIDLRFSDVIIGPKELTKK